jgi:hypothetical protein
VLALSCASEHGFVVSTEINLDIVHPSGSSTDLGFTVDRVDYRITCVGNPVPGAGGAGGAPYPIPPSNGNGDDYEYDDAVDMSGSFEIIDTRIPPVWQAALDLPPGDCTMTLSVWDGDEIVCVGSQTLIIVEDTSTKFDIVLVCSVSADLPEGGLRVDGTLDLIDGNYCPQLIWLGADPTVVAAAVPAITNIQTYSFDPDNQCGENCDPQTCDYSVNPPICTPAPDPGLISTFFATSGVGTFADPNAFNTTYTCDPLFPGPTEICALASDGDIECDRTRCLTIVCP